MESFLGGSGRTWSFDTSARIGDASGMGQVYRGLSEAGEAIAVKRVRLTLDAEADRRRREREVEVAGVLAGITPRHVLPVLDIGRVDDDLLIVMPLAARSLAAAIAVDALDDQDKLRAVRHVALGLVELAEASVLHRDLKPANVLEHDGRWQLADFGIARVMYEATGTFTMQGWGTSRYVAPELWVGQPATVKSDLYALGVLAWEVLTGGPPFPGPARDDYERQHRFAPVPDPLGVDPSIARLLVRLLAKNPADRPQDARSVVEAIERYGRPLPPVGEALRAAGLAAQLRRAEADAAVARAQDARADVANARAEAIADLQAIVEAARDIAADALSDVALRGDGAQWHLVWESFRVTILPWPGVPHADGTGDDPMIVAGAVYIWPTGSSPSANVVCERIGQKSEWSLLRFRANAIAANGYGLGPAKRLHGFDQQVFAAERTFMLKAVTHVWVMERQPLTAELVATLLIEAIEHGPEVIR